MSDHTPPTTTDVLAGLHPTRTEAEYQRVVAERDAARAAGIREMARFLDEYAERVYGPEIFQRPTDEDYAEINALLKRGRRHQLDGIAADCYSRALTLASTWLHQRADEIDRDRGE